MATFLMFGKYSAEALKGMSAQRTKKASDFIKKLGGKVTAMYAMLGHADLLLIVDLPGMEQAIQASVGLGKMTGVAFCTAPAVTVQEFDKLVAGK
jgi:uncharacterized protein with GYD domain